MGILANVSTPELKISRFCSEVASTTTSSDPLNPAPSVATPTHGAFGPNRTPVQCIVYAVLLDNGSQPNFEDVKLPLHQDHISQLTVGTIVIT